MIFLVCIGNTKSKYPIVKLGDVCKIYQSKTISQKELKSDGKYIVFGANGIIGRYDEYNHQEPEVLVTCRGATCGTVNLSKEKCWITGNAMVVTPLKKGQLIKQFLFRVLSQCDLSKVISGSAQPQITKQKLSPFQIPLPPISIQKEIVKKIESYLNVLEKSERAILEMEFLIKDLEKSISQQYLSNSKCPTVRIGDVCKIYQSKTISQKELKSDGKYIVFGANGIIGRYDEYNHREPEVLITCRGATCGTVNLSKEKCWITGNAMVVTPLKKGQLIKQFLFRVLSQCDLSKVISGSAQPQITKQKLSPFQIPLPPISAQKEIVKKIERDFLEMSLLKENLKTLQIESNYLKKSAMQEFLKVA